MKYNRWAEMNRNSFCGVQIKWGTRLTILSLLIYLLMRETYTKHNNKEYKQVHKNVVNSVNKELK